VEKCERKRGWTGTDICPRVTLYNGGRWRLPPDIGRTNYQPTGPTDVVFTQTVAVQIVNEQTKTIIEIEKSSQSSWQRFYLIVGARTGLVAATGGDSAGVSQTDAGRPWAAATAAWLVIQGVVAGMHCESQRILWDVRYTGGGRLERRVERWVAECLP